MEGPSRANSDVLPEVTGSRWSRRPRWVSWVLILVAAMAFLWVAGAAYATYEYSRRYEGRILPGARIAGVDVSGMRYETALQAVQQAIEPELERTVEVTWGDRTWRVTPASIGARSDAEAAVRSALDASRRASFLSKAGMRLLGTKLSFERSIAISYPRQGARGFIEGIASSFDREPREAALDYSSGWVDVVPARAGRKVRIDRSHKALMRMLRTGGSETELSVRTTEPEDDGDRYDQVLLVRIGENKLYLYEDGKITRTWTVATGQPEYMTPTGLFEVTEKRYMPTWVNPAPDTWGADMPASIPPGPSNPLGLRAINWSAPAIRFHGTSATYSLGYNASHGCVRMSNEDVIELYDIVEVGTPIVSVVAGPLKPMYASSSDPVPVADPQPVPGRD